MYTPHIPISLANISCNYFQLPPYLGCLTCYPLSLPLFYHTLSALTPTYAKNCIPSSCLACSQLSIQVCPENAQTSADWLGGPAHLLCPQCCPLWLPLHKWLPCERADKLLRKPFPDYSGLQGGSSSATHKLSIYQFILRCFMTVPGALFPLEEIGKRLTGRKRGLTQTPFDTQQIWISAYHVPSIWENTKMNKIRSLPSQMSTDVQMRETDMQVTV